MTADLFPAALEAQTAELIRVAGEEDDWPMLHQAAETIKALADRNAELARLVVESNHLGAGFRRSSDAAQAKIDAALALDPDDFYDDGYAEEVHHTLNRAISADPVTHPETERAKERLIAALGEAMDCTRVWSAWGYNTMGPDDFVQIADDEARLQEILTAVLGPAHPETEPSGFERFEKTAARFPTAVAAEIGLWMRSAGYDPSTLGEYERWAKDYGLPHEFQPVAGHPDDDECTDRRDGTDATYCGLPRRLHEYPHSQQYDAEEGNR